MQKAKSLEQNREMIHISSEPLNPKFPIQRIKDENV